MRKCAIASVLVVALALWHDGYRIDSLASDFTPDNAQYHPRAERPEQCGCLYPQPKKIARPTPAVPPRSGRRACFCHAWTVVDLLTKKGSYIAGTVRSRTTHPAWGWSTKQLARIPSTAFSTSSSASCTPAEPRGSVCPGAFGGCKNAGL